MCSKFAMSWTPTNETVLEGLMNSHFQSIEWEQTTPFLTRVWIHCVRRVLSRTPFFLHCEWNLRQLLQALLALLLPGNRAGQIVSSPIPVTTRPKAYACGRSLAAIAGSNPGVRTDVCLLWLLCVDRNRFLRRADNSPEESYLVWCDWVWSRSLDIEEARAD